MLVSQTVLLKGVNDDPETLIDLMRAFVEARVKPYYLHHGDLAPGTSHWRVSIARGQELMRLLRARLSGLATPTYMLDIPGGHGKAQIGPQWIHGGEDGEHVTIEGDRTCLRRSAGGGLERSAMRWNRPRAEAQWGGACVAAILPAPLTESVG